MIYHANIDARLALKTEGWLSLVDANYKMGQLLQELHIRTGSPTNCLLSTSMEQEQLGVLGSWCAVTPERVRNRRRELGVVCLRFCVLDIRFRNR